MTDVDFNRLVFLFIFSGFCINRPSEAKPATSSESAYKRVCYYTNWSQYRKAPAKFLPYHIHPFLCTHLIFAFAKINSQKLVAPYEWNDIDYPHMYKQFNRLKKKNPDVKTLLAVGGWSMASQPFTAMVRSKGSRKDFIIHAIRYLRTHNFDGLDLDWEYPANRGSPPEDKQRFVELVKELRLTFEREAVETNAPRLLLSAAVGCGEKTIRSAYNVSELSKYLDFINLMTYDLHGGWESTLQINAPLYPRKDEIGKAGEKATVNWAVQKWINLGADRKKLILGIPMYGRGFTFCTQQVVPGSLNCGMSKPGRFTRERGFLSYYEIKLSLKRGWKREWDAQQGVPYAYSLTEKQWVGYDDEDSIRLKVEYLKKHQLGGAMTWSLPLDDFDNIATQGKKFPLHSLIKELLEKADSPTLPSTDQKHQEPTFKISDNSFLHGTNHLPPYWHDGALSGKALNKNEEIHNLSPSSSKSPRLTRPYSSLFLSHSSSAFSSTAPSSLFSPTISRLSLPFPEHSHLPLLPSSLSPTHISLISPTLPSALLATTTSESISFSAKPPNTSSPTSSFAIETQAAIENKSIPVLQTLKPVNNSFKIFQITESRRPRKRILPKQTNTLPFSTTNRDIFFKSRTGHPVLKILFPPQNRQTSRHSIIPKMPDYAIRNKVTTKHQASQRQMTLSFERTMMTKTVSMQSPSIQEKSLSRSQVQLLSRHEPCDGTTRDDTQAPKHFFSEEFTCPTLFGLYPDLIDCTRFYQCVWLVPFSYKCAPGTAWNQRITACDWPNHDGCVV